MSDLLYALADSMPYWRPSAIAGLAAVIILCGYLYASVYDE